MLRSIHNFYTVIIPIAMLLLCSILLIFYTDRCKALRDYDIHGIFIKNKRRI